MIAPSEFPSRVTVRDVSPRDGLQSIEKSISTEHKVALVDALSAAGVTRIEAASFVSPRVVPQMADARAVFAGIHRREGVSYEALVPNLRGAADAVEAGVEVLLVIVAASDEFAARNVGMSVEETFAELGRIADFASRNGATCIGSVTTAFGCAYEGPIADEIVTTAVHRCADLGTSEVFLCDTMGMAHPGQVDRLVGKVQDQQRAGLRVGLHFHDTRGLGLANVLVGLSHGIDLFDGSLGGIGGCPFAPKATGNVTTEDLAHMLCEMGIETGLDVEALISTAVEAQRWLGVRLPGHVMTAGPRWAMPPV